MTCPTPSFDLYDDLVSFDHLTEDAGKLYQAESEISNLKDNVEYHTKVNSDLLKKNEFLVKNISKLYKTAKKEIELRDAKIKDLTEQIEELKRRYRTDRSCSRIIDKRRHSDRRSRCRSSRRSPEKSRSPKRRRDRSISPRCRSRDRRQSSKSSRHRCSKTPVKESTSSNKIAVEKDDKVPYRNDKVNKTLEDGEIIEIKSNSKNTDSKERDHYAKKKSQTFGVIKSDKHSKKDILRFDKKLSSTRETTSRHVKDVSRKENKQDSNKQKKSSLESSPSKTPLKERNSKNLTDANGNVEKNCQNDRNLNEIQKLNNIENPTESFTAESIVDVSSPRCVDVPEPMLFSETNVQNAIPDHNENCKLNSFETLRQKLNNHLLKNTGLDKKELDAKLEEVSERNEKIIKEQEDNCIISDYKRAMHAVRTMDKKSKKRKRMSSDLKQSEEQENLDDNYDVASIPSVQSISSINSSISAQVQSVKNIIEIARKQTKFSQDRPNNSNIPKLPSDNYFPILINLPPWSRVKMPKLDPINLRSHSVTIPHDKLSELEDPRINHYHLKGSLSIELLRNDEDLQKDWGTIMSHFDNIIYKNCVPQHSEMDISKNSLNSSKKSLDKSLSISNVEEFDGKICSSTKEDNFKTKTISSSTPFFKHKINRDFAVDVSPVTLSDTKNPVNDNLKKPPTRSLPIVNLFGTKSDKIERPKRTCVVIEESTVSSLLQCLLDFADKSMNKLHDTDNDRKNDDLDKMFDRAFQVYHTPDKDLYLPRLVCDDTNATSLSNWPNHDFVPPMTDDITMSSPSKCFDKYLNRMASLSDVSKQ